MKANFIGTAGWSIAKVNQDFYPAGASHLARYGATFNAVEINSSFRNTHRAATYERWAATVPESFRFSVKLPKQLTHYDQLRSAPAELAAHLAPILALGEKLGVLLMQLPPRLAFDPRVAERFFGRLRALTAVPVVCEPRHRAWLAAASLFREYRVGKVIADPAPCPDPAGEFSGAGAVDYFRLHGSPRIYYSPYSDRVLEQFATRVTAAAAAERWVIFDNTAEFHAAPDALRFRSLLRERAEAASWGADFRDASSYR